MERVKINLFEQLTFFFGQHKEHLPEGVDLSLMKISTDDDIIANLYGKTEVSNYPVDFRGDLGNPLISAHYNFVFYGLQLVEVSLLDDKVAF